MYITLGRDQEVVADLARQRQQAGAIVDVKLHSRMREDDCYHDSSTEPTSTANFSD